jgi:hypothetical protein
MEFRIMYTKDIVINLLLDDELPTRSDELTVQFRHARNLLHMAVWFIDTATLNHHQQAFVYIFKQPLLKLRSRH